MSSGQSELPKVRGARDRAPREVAQPSQGPASQNPAPGRRTLLCLQWAWAMGRRTASVPTCTTSSQKEVSAWGFSYTVGEGRPELCSRACLPLKPPLPPPRSCRRSPLPPAPPLDRDCAVTDLAGRIFATWTLTSCMLCLICARNPSVPAIYGERRLAVRQLGAGCWRRLAVMQLAGLPGWLAGTRLVGWAKGSHILPACLALVKMHTCLVGLLPSEKLCFCSRKATPAQKAPALAW